jgi:hypothetical protein
MDLSTVQPFSEIQNADDREPNAGAPRTNFSAPLSQTIATMEKSAVVKGTSCLPLSGRGALAKFLIKPGSSDVPVALNRTGGDARDFSGLILGETSEKS